MAAEVCGWRAEAFADSIISGMAVLARSRFANFMIFNSHLEKPMFENAKLSVLFPVGLFRVLKAILTFFSDALGKHGEKLSRCLYRSFSRLGSGKAPATDAMDR